MARFPIFGIVEVIVLVRKPKDWEPPRPPTNLPKDAQKKLDKIGDAVDANNEALKSVLRKK